MYQVTLKAPSGSGSIEVESRGEAVTKVEQILESTKDKGYKVMWATRTDGSITRATLGNGAQVVVVTMKEISQ